MIENKHFCRTKKKDFPDTLRYKISRYAKYLENLQPIMNFPVSIADTLTGFFLLWSCLYLFLHLFIVVLFANKTPLGEPDGQVAATICLPCPALSPLYLSSVFTSRYCFPCIYNPCALKDIVSPVFIICVLYNISKYCPPVFIIHVRTL